ncbi:SMI1/KNR4 family protein [Clostridium botulinum]|nr:SMI1/KNR4 family protein [Clostridium botulinum]
MENIIKVIKQLDNLRYLNGASEDEIKNAQQKLNLLFASDYKNYLEIYGAIIAKGVELTGLNVSSRINVVEVTLNERKNNNIPNNMYVIENIAIEGIIILQNEKAEIFELRENGKLNMIYNNLKEYIISKK